MLIVVLAVGLTGCATSGYRTGEKSADTLGALAKRIEGAGMQMDIAVTELNNMVNNPQPDLRPQFNRFAAAVNKLNTLSNSISQANAQLEERGKLHFTNWDKELATIQNEAIRGTALARKLEVQSRFDAVRNTCLNLLTGFAPVQSDLRDLQSFLNADLNPSGLAAIKAAAGNVTERATPVRESIGKLVAELRDLGGALSPQSITAAAPVESSAK